MELDYIIIGSGLAGIAFAETCINNGKKIRVINDSSQNSTTIAGGLYNPVVLKRFTKIWEAENQLEISIPFYKKLEQKLKTKFLFEISLYRKLNSIEEQNNWFIASDKPSLTAFLNSSLVNLNHPFIEEPYKFGKVNHTGFLDTFELKQTYINYLRNLNILIEDTFDYSKLKIEESFIQYEEYKAKQIVFAEGFGIHANPHFNNLPLDGTKGELLIIKAPDLKLDKIINSSIFFLPIGNDLYKVGATYNWEDKSTNLTEEGKKELVSNLKELISCPFEIVEHFAGIRPTVKDRRPLLGNHYQYKNLYILNGLGTRGVLFAPYLADKLFNFIENGIELDNEISVNRIYKKLFR
ncbi:NAD(P)/FAD-dependent oxidoreductase [Flavobacterium urocaniciphilum]|uniref:Glycine/D-amino acid oxidase n=1 Tax=Flavobacterium urocaniciphilum TaxID=1299341 RepID=A0A1H9ARP1_9FLAO|nr:FAD-dependent oxidoreductase [Flavobacterium urocaniciphilum]SEP79205.1 Glycine/D-amino acid oxidase [Flavobacterium urocaniciphilum]